MSKKSVLRNPLMSLNDGYLKNPDRYVYPFVIDEGEKERRIITYNNDPRFGGKLRTVHERIAIDFKDNFCERNKYSYAYHKGIRCLDALEEHLKSNYFIKLDIHHFFESITEEVFFEVYGDLFNNNWKSILRNVFYKGALSIGFVTSPIISDYFMSIFDKNVEGFIASHEGLHYSRYSDDMLISSEEDEESLNELFEFIKGELEVLHLTINEKKTRRVHLELLKHNSLHFLGLNLSKEDEVNNKVTISKSFILILLRLIAKNDRYLGRCRELIAEINSRVAYLAYNSPISYARFQKKHINIYGRPFSFDETKLNSRKVDNKTEQIKDYEQYSAEFDFNIHANVVNKAFGKVVVRDGVELLRYKGRSETVEIPNFVNSIASGAFRYSLAKKIILHEGINAIREEAFKSSRIESINLPKSLVLIDNSAFADTKHLEEIIIPVNLRAINPGVFKDSALKRVVFQENSKLTSIGNYAFAGTNIEEIVFPSEVNKIEQYAFARCTKLKNIVLNEKIISLPPSCFEGCETLTEVDFKDNLLSVESNVFTGCFNLRKVNIGKGLISIPNNAFQGCHNLKEINIDEDNSVYLSRFGAELIEKGAKKLIYTNNDDPRLDENVIALNASVFQGKDYTSLDLSNIEEIGSSALSDCAYLKEVKLSNLLKSLGKEAFSGCISLKEIVIPDSLTYIPEHAFEGCYRLRRVVLHDNITLIDKYAFSGDKELFDIALPKSLIKIGHNAFASCLSIKEIHIGEKVNNISRFAFQEMSKHLESITVDKKNTSYTDGDMNVLIERKHNVLFLACQNTTGIPEGTNVIASHAFAYVPKIKHIELPLSVTTIEKGAFSFMNDLESINLNCVYAIKERAFYGSTNLKEARLPTSLTTVGGEAFAHTSLKEVIIPNSLTSIGLDVFSHNDSLESIKLPSNLDSFRPDWFNYCPNIESIEVDPKNKVFYTDENHKALILRDDLSDDGDVLFYGSKHLVIPDYIKRLRFMGSYGLANIEEIIIPEGVKLLPDYAFSCCFNLKKVVLPSTLKKIGSGAFENCISLEELIIPESVTHIDSSAFLNCTTLKELVFPSGLDEISYFLCNGCKSLTKVVFKDASSLLTQRRGEKGDSISFSASAFQNCSSLTSVELNNVKDLDVEIDNLAFAGCTSLKKLDFAKNIIVLAHSAFANTPELEFDFSSDKLERIGGHVFANNKVIKNIVIGKNVDSLSSDAFEDMDIESFEVKKGNTHYYSHNNAIMMPMSENLIVGMRFFTQKDDGPEIKVLFIGCKNTVIDDSVDAIYECAFKGVKGLKKISIPSSVKIIRGEAFANMEDLEEVEFAGNEINFIGAKHFMDSCKLKKVTGYNHVNQMVTDSMFMGTALEHFDLSNIVKLNANSFAFCPLKEIVIPSCLKMIDSSAFKYVPGNILEKIIVDKDNAYFKTFDTNILFDIRNNKMIIASKNANIQAIKSFNKNVSIAPEAFFMNDDIESINIPEGVVSLSNNTFSDCKNVKEIHLPASLISIDPYAFEGLDNLEKIVVHKDNLYYRVENNCLIENRNNKLIVQTYNSKMPESVTSIAPGALLNVANMKELYVSRRVRTIENGFTSNLERIVVNKNNPYLDSRDNSNTLCITRSDTAVLLTRHSKLSPSVRRIAENALVKDELFKEFYVPENINFIHSLALKSNKYLEKIIVDKKNETFKNDDENKQVIIKKDNDVIVAVEGYKTIDLRKALLRAAERHLLAQSVVKKDSFVELTDNDLPF